MKKILFVCHGNICRSVTAEFVMRRMAEEAGVGERFEYPRLLIAFASGIMQES